MGVSTEIPYEDLVSGVPCPNCQKAITIRDATKTAAAGTFGHLERKVRIVKCPACSTESQFQSER